MKKKELFHTDAPARCDWRGCRFLAGGEESISGEQANGGALLLLGPGPGGLGHVGPAQEPVDRAQPHTVSSRTYVSQQGSDFLKNIS